MKHTTVWTVAFIATLSLIMLLFYSTAIGQEQQLIKPPQLDTIDIAGVKIGDTPDKVQDILKKDRPKISIQNATSAVDGKPYIFSLEMSDPLQKRSDYVRVFFSDPISGNQAISIESGRGDDISKGITIESVTKAMKDKYGNPLIDSSKSGNVIMQWIFEQDGSLVKDKQRYGVHCFKGGAISELKFKTIKQQKCTGTAVLADIRSSKGFVVLMTQQISAFDLAMNSYKTIEATLEATRQEKLKELKGNGNKNVPKL